jgi:hypothetical protein
MISALASLIELDEAIRAFIFSLQEEQERNNYTYLPC